VEHHGGCERLTALSGIVVICAPVSMIADMFRMCLGFFCLRWNLDVFVVEVRTVFAFDVTPVVGLDVTPVVRWKKMSSSSVVVLLPPGTLLWLLELELVASLSSWLLASATRMR
jgi:hypothetical protein